MVILSKMRGLVTGQSEPSGPILAGRVIRDVSSEIALLDANNAPLMTLLMKLRKAKCSQPKFEWQEDTFPAQVTEVATTDSTTTDTTITVDAGEVGRAGDLFWNADSDEIVYIESVSGDVWTIYRGVGGTTPADMTVDDELYYIGNAQPMGWHARPPLTIQVTQPWNYAQLFKESFEVTGTLNATTLYGGSDLAYQRRKHGDLHKRDIERAFWFGDRDLLDSSEASTLMSGTGTAYQTAAYMTRGVWKWIQNADGWTHLNTTTLTEDEFNTYLESDFRYGNGVKFMFCSPLCLSVIASWGRDKLRVVPRDTTFGINITRYISPHGELNLINNKLFGDMTVDNSEATNPAKASCILDIEQLKYRYLRDTRLEMGIQGADQDSEEDQYLTEAGLELGLPEHHALIFGWQL